MDFSAMGIFGGSGLIVNSEQCEHVVGVTLSNRKSLIKFSQISEDNVYAGIVIGQAFVANIEALDDEFDALTLYYCWNILSSFGATETDFIEGVSNVLDNFEIEKPIRYLYSRRMKDYQSLSHEEIGTKLLSNIRLIYSGEESHENPKILGKQLNNFAVKLEGIIKGELSA